jgi:hypothetical protein
MNLSFQVPDNRKDIPPTSWPRCIHDAGQFLLRGNKAGFWKKGHARITGSVRRQHLHLSRYAAPKQGYVYTMAVRIDGYYFTYL